MIHDRIAPVQIEIGMVAHAEQCRTGSCRLETHTQSYVIEDFVGDTRVDLSEKTARAIGALQAQGDAIRLGSLNLPYLVRKPGATAVNMMRRRAELQ